MPYVSELCSVVWFVMDLETVNLCLSFVQYFVY